MTNKLIMWIIQGLHWVIRRDMHGDYFAVPRHGKIFNVELHSESGKSISTNDDIVLVAARGIHHLDRVFA